MTSTDTTAHSHADAEGCVSRRNNGFVSEDMNGVVDGDVVTITETPSPREIETFVERASWSNKFEFVLSTLGLAVGLGCVWRLPYIAYNNGGGAFLIPFLLFLVFTGIPMFFMELSLGQFPSRSCVNLWSMCPPFKGVGYAMVFVNILLCSYYNVIISWTIHFLVASMRSHLPWSDCNNAWNDIYCVELRSLKNITGASIMVNGTEITRKEFQTPSEQYFYNHVLQLSSGIEETGGVVWQLALYLLFAWIVVFCVLIKGVSSLGKVVYVSILLPYVLLTVSFVRGVTLDGALDGIIYYLKPNFSKLTNPRSWIDACTQVIYSLSIGTGGLHNMGSFSRFKNNSLRDTMLVSTLTIATGFFAGFSVFSVLGFMAKQKGVSVADVAAGGPGLMFVTFPEGISTMPLPPLWSFLFFFMMTLLGLSSQFSNVESVLSALMDEFPVLRKSRRNTLIFRAIVCTAFYLVGLCMVTQGGFYVFSLIDSFIGSFALMITTLAEMLVIMYVYGYANLARDIEMMIGQKPPLFYRLSWSLFSPILICAVLVFFTVKYETPSLFSGRYQFPLVAEVVGWGLVTICLLLIIGRFLYVIFRNGVMDVIRTSVRPSKDWGPALTKHRTGDYAEMMEKIDSKSSSDFEIKIEQKSESL